MYLFPNSLRESIPKREIALGIGIRTGYFEGLPHRFSGFCVSIILRIAIPSQIESSVNFKKNIFGIIL